MKNVSGKQTRRAYKIGRVAFGKISAVEGIQLTSAMEAEFRDFDRKRLSATARRRAIAKKFGRNP